MVYGPLPSGPAASCATAVVASREEVMADFAQKGGLPFRLPVSFSWCPRAVPRPPLSGGTPPASQPRQAPVRAARRLLGICRRSALRYGVPESVFWLPIPSCDRWRRLVFPLMGLTVFPLGAVEIRFSCFQFTAIGMITCQ